MRRVGAVGACAASTLTLMWIAEINALSRAHAHAAAAGHEATAAVRAGDPGRTMAPAAASRTPPASEAAGHDAGVAADVDAGMPFEGLDMGIDIDDTHMDAMISDHGGDELPSESCMPIASATVPPNPAGALCCTPRARGVRPLTSLLQRKRLLVVAVGTVKN